LPIKVLLGLPAERSCSDRAKPLLGGVSLLRFCLNSALSELGVFGGLTQGYATLHPGLWVCRAFGAFIRAFRLGLTVPDNLYLAALVLGLT